ncbi:hypothetical protein ACIQVR_39530 [Streptomyces xanthochromogenes]|uniref:hypothetical protein n=1 Tax=Streptomyces xanthochromogenes TaxID=67384 RepID=UPI003813C67E
MANPDEAALLANALYQSLVGMGPDADRVAELEVCTIDGERVGKVVLSERDVKGLLALLAAVGVITAGDEPDGLETVEVDEAAVAAVADAAGPELIADVEAFLAEGGA